MSYVVYCGTAESLTTNVRERLSRIYGGAQVVTPAEHAQLKHDAKRAAAAEAQRVEREKKQDALMVAAQEESSKALAAAVEQLSAGTREGLKEIAHALLRLSEA